MPVTAGRRLTMKILRKVLVFTFLAVLIVTYYIHLSSKSAKDIEATVDDSVVGQLLAVDMELNYPANPRAVVLYYSQIIKAFYGEEYTDDQLIGLAQHARAMFDDELLEANDYDEYMERLRTEIAAYAVNGKTITDYVVQRASDVQYSIVQGQQYAKVNTVYYTRESSTKHDKVYECYTLRKDDADNWKILYWEVVSENNVKGE